MIVVFKVLSEETREKIRKMQRRQNWMDPLPFTFGAHLTNTTSHAVPSAPDATTTIIPPEAPSSVHSEPQLKVPW